MFVVLDLGTLYKSVFSEAKANMKFLNINIKRKIVSFIREVNRMEVKIKKEVSCQYCGTMFEMYLSKNDFKIYQNGLDIFFSLFTLGLTG